MQPLCMFSGLTRFCSCAALCSHAALCPHPVRRAAPRAPRRTPRQLCLLVSPRMVQYTHVGCAHRACGRRTPRHAARRATPRRTPHRASRPSLCSRCPPCAPPICDLCRGHCAQRSLCLLHRSRLVPLALCTSRLGLCLCVSGELTKNSCAVSMLQDVIANYMSTRSSLPLPWW